MPPNKQWYVLFELRSGSWSPHEAGRLFTERGAKIVANRYLKVGTLAEVHRVRPQALVQEFLRDGDRFRLIRALADLKLVAYSHGSYSLTPEGRAAMD